MEKKDKKLVPELRFGEFEREWIVTKLGDIATFRKGKGISKADIDENGNNYCIRYGELYTYYSEIIEHVKSKTNLDSDTLVLSEENDVIIPASGESQIDIATASCVLKKGIALGGDLNIIKTKHNGIFLAYYFNSARKKEIARLSQGISVVHLYKSQLASLNLFLPQNSGEQQKIANFLTAVDRRIQLLQKKATHLQAYKKGMMQQLFSRQLRFKDENGEDFGEWEEKRLGGVAVFSKGKGISKNDIVEDGELPCIRYGELYTRYSEVINHIFSSTNLDKNGLVLSEGNEVIIPSSGETQIDIATASCVIKEGIALGGDLNILKSEINGVFLAYFLNNARKHEIASLSQGISVVHLYSKQLKQLSIKIPHKQEQQKIANFLSKIDKRLALVDDKIETLQTWKKGLLQKMLV